MAIRLNVFEGRQAKVDDYGSDLGLCISFNYQGNTGTKWFLGPARAQWLGWVTTKNSAEVEKLVKSQFKGTGLFND